MIRSLRGRLVFSHIIPLLIVVPLLYLGLNYVFETGFVIPRLTHDLISDGRMLTEIAHIDYLTPGDQRSLQLYLLRLQPSPQVRLVYLEPNGNVAYSNDPSYLTQVGEQIDPPGLKQALRGEEVVLTRNSILPTRPFSIDVLLPVEGKLDQVVGVLWMTYYETSITRLFKETRMFSVLIVLGGLLIGALLGFVLALSIDRPVGQVTGAIRSLARGERSEVLIEQGPDEIRGLVREVNVLVTRLHSLEQARRQLLANLVHELGRPLGALRSAIQALNRGAAEDPQLFQDLTAGMDEETARLQGILNELAHIHDQVLGSLELQREPVKFTEWLSRTLIPWQQAALEKRLSWKTEIPSDLPEVSIDKVRFAQVIGNLVSNAIKYTPVGGSIWISSGVEDLQVWVCFRDNGPGIPGDEQKKLFQPFFQGSYGRRIKQGMGLGLSIAQDLAAAHGGRITVESAPGTGSSFTVWVPVLSNTGR